MNNASTKFSYRSAVTLSILADLLNRYSGDNFRLADILEIRFVVDTCEITPTLIRKHDNPTFLSSFEELSQSGVCVFMIPHWAITELKDSAIAQIAKEHDLSEARLLEEWEKLKPCFEIHEGYSYPNKAGWFAEKLDWDDEPFSSLQKDQNATAILSWNKRDLEALGGTVMTAKVLGPIREYAQSETVCVTFKLGGMLTLHMTLEGLEALIPYLKNGVSKVPMWAWYALLGCAAGAYIHKPTRERISGTASKAKDFAWPLMQLGMTTYLKEREAANSLREEIKSELRVT